MSESVILDARFCGPSASGNGSYCSRALPRFLQGTARVTLRKPIPPRDSA